ncbi:unnamed protein product [Musa banksii]
MLVATSSVQLLVLVGAALVGLRVVLAVLLQGITGLELVPGVAGRRAQLLNLVPRRGALPARRVLRARLLRFLDALHHLLRYVRRRGRRACHQHQPAGGRSAAAGPWKAEHPFRQLWFWELRLRGDDASGGGAHTGGCRRHG